MATDTKKVARLTPREKAQKFPTSGKLAIAAYCYHECHNQKETNSHITKVAIRDCISRACPLWPLRGWQKITGGTVGKREAL